jgi:mannose-6-phosphate isomerase-like protein (cupin superfamily)
MAVFTSGAVLSDAPGFHYHDRAHDVFLVTKGFLKLYNGDQCRIMGPGDFAYVPPVCERIIEREKQNETYANFLVRKSFTCPT